MATPPSAVSISPAGLLRHLGAICYDTLLLFGALFMATVLVLPLTGGEAIEAGNPLFSFYILTVCFFFYGWFWTHGGQTLGMRAWKIRLQSCNGGNVTGRQALLRFSLASIWLLPIIYLRQILGIHYGLSLGIGLIFLIFLLTIRFHDRYSDTVLVRIK
jgi:uncharacterized RDD family membrane protein YckC